MADAYKMDGTEWRNRIVGYDSVDPETLLANPRNFRAHPKGQQDVLTGTLNEVGWVDDVLVNRVTGHVIDGHLRVQLALRKGMDSIPVKYVELSEAEEALILATFDPIAAMATHDAELLDAVLRDVETGDEHVQAMLAEMAEDAGLYTDGGDVEDVEPQTDKAEALREQWGVTTGQLWLLDSGNGHPHRLICGDCIDADVVARLMDGERAVCMWTDPPYGVSYVGKTKDALTIENDGADDLPRFIGVTFSVADGVLADGAPVYVAHPAGALQMVFNQCFVDAGWHFHETLVWVKNSMVLGHSDYHYKHEPIMYGWKGTNRKWYAGRDQVSVFEVDRPSRSEEHPTMKPVGLITDMLRNSTRRSDIVYEPFSGSGTTIIACEQLARQCRAVEISPAYVSVALQRFLDATGCTPHLLE